MDQTKGSGLHAYLTTFFSTSSSSQRTSNINISSASCITRQLKNPGTIFEQMCGSNRTRAWLGRAMRRNKPVYMVSGIQSLVDTQVNESDERVLKRPIFNGATRTASWRIQWLACFINFPLNSKNTKTSPTKRPCGRGCANHRN